MAQEEMALDICVLGDSGVGKTALVQKLANPDMTFETIAAHGCSTVVVDYKNFHRELVMEPGRPPVHLNVRIWDTAGQERFRTVTKQYTRNKDVIIFVFQMSSPSAGNIRHSSLEHLKGWYTDMMPMEANSPDRNSVATAVCCTKVDLASTTDPGHLDETLKVCRETAMEAIVSHSHDVHILGRTSCITGEGIDQFFDAVFRAAVRVKREKLADFGFLPGTRRRIEVADLDKVAFAARNEAKEKVDNTSSCC